MANCSDLGTGRPDGGLSAVEWAKSVHFRVVDTAECTINSPLLFYYPTNLYTAKSLQKLRLRQEEYRAFVRLLRETF